MMKRLMLLLCVCAMSLSALAVDVVFDFDELASGKQNVYTLDVTADENPSLADIGISKVELRLTAVISSGYSRFVNNEGGDGLLGINTGTSNRSWDAATDQAFVFEFDLFDVAGDAVTQDITVDSITANVSNVDNGYKVYVSNYGYRHSGGNNVKVYLKWLMVTKNDDGHSNVAKSNVINPPATGLVDVELVTTAGAPFKISSDNTMWIRRQNTNGASNETNQLQAVTISIADPRVALNPVPADDSQNVSEDSVLQWNAGDDPNNPGNRLPNVVEYYVSYASYDVETAPSEPNFVTDTTATVTVTDPGVDPVQTSSIAFGMEKKVFWRVDQALDVADPNGVLEVVAGEVWSFETELPIPFVMASPQSVLVDAGVTTNFTIQYTSDSSPSVAWYREGQVDPISGLDADVTIAETLVDGVYENTLTIDNVEAADEGKYYAVVTNGGGSVSSDSAALAVKRLAAHYTLDLADYDQVDKLYLDTVDNTYPAAVADVNAVPVFVDGYNAVADSAVDFDPNTVGLIGDWNPSELSGQLSVSCWVKWDGGDLGTSGRVIVAKNDSWGTSTQMWLLKLRDSDDAGENAGIWFYNANGLGVQVSPQIAIDTWAHVVAQYDGSNGSVYVNGALVASDNGEFGTGLASMLSIGDGAFPGMIDDVRIYNYAMDKYDIAQLYYDFTGNKTCLDSYANTYDFNDDCVVDMADFADFAASWLSSGLYPLN